MSREAPKLGSNEVMGGEFAALVVNGHPRAVPGPWRAACLSSYTGPVWVFTNDDGDVVPLSAVEFARRATVP